MRKLVVFFKASCPVLSVFILICYAAHMAYGQQVPGLTDSVHMQLLSGLYISFPHKIISIDGLKKTSPTGLPAPPISFTDTTTALLQLSVAYNDSTATGDSILFTGTNTAEDSGAKADNAESYKVIINHSRISVTGDGLDPLINKYAEMISLDPSDIVNFPLYNFIEQWYGTRYRFGGTDNTGIDCSAFSKRLYGDVYKTGIDRNSRQQRRHSEQIGEDEAGEGDLVFFRMHHLRVSHVGVYLANGYFVHASRSRGVVISSLNDKYWQRRFAGCGRIERQERVTTESGAMQ